MGHSKYVVDAFTRLWPLGKMFYRLGNKPILGRLVKPLFNALDSAAIIIPVHETVQGTESIELPYPVLKPLVEQASVRFILNQCVCRRGENCHSYPQDFGCLFLGDGAAELHPTMGRLSTAEEALAHVSEAMDLGLAPMVVQSAFDAWMFGVPYRRTLGVCFCCECCCAVRQGLRIGPPSFGDQVVRLPGLTVEVGPECTGCGLCVEMCYVKAIGFQDGQVTINGDCKGCGRCATVCPTGAIRLRVNSELNTMEHLMARIGQRDRVTDSELAPYHA
ncbi:MAG: 4Fe-4S binding protein [Chloroflexi bacterium]|nr:4Fe-4S binding protein [Chloroflexota bacterium]